MKVELGLTLQHLPCSLQSADLKIHTVHVEDVCAAALLTAEWMSKMGREKADKEVGVDLGFSEVDKESLGDMEGSCKPSLWVSQSTHSLCQRGLPWLISRSRLPEQGTESSAFQHRGRRLKFAHVSSASPCLAEGRPKLTSQPFASTSHAGQDWFGRREALRHQSRLLRSGHCALCKACAQDRQL